MKKSVRILVLSLFTLAILSILFTLYLKIGVSRPAPAPPPAIVVGEYDYGTNAGGLEITLRENGTYTAYRYGSDANGEQERIEGIYTLKEGMISFTPNRAEQKPWQAYIVPWGRRAYLLKEGDFERFCKAIQKGEEPRKGGQSDDFPLYNDKETTQPTGLPTFPPAWRPLLKGVRVVTPGIAPGYAYIYRATKAALEFYKHGYTKEAMRYATDALERSRYAEPGEAPLHDLNILLGAIALKAGRVERAKTYLREAAQAFPVRSSSPYRGLLQGLWARGEREAVLAYLEALIKKEDDPERTADWKSGVMSGKIPALFALDEE